jgi:parvulin-like peptidyl-prolyl isomerase
MMLLIAPCSSSASVVVRQWQQTWERDLDTAYEEFIQSQLEHYLETENLEIQQLEDEYNEHMNQIAFNEQMEDKELQLLNDEQLQQREQFEQQRLLEQLEHLGHSQQLDRAHDT